MCVYKLIVFRTPVGSPRVHFLQKICIVQGRGLFLRTAVSIRGQRTQICDYGGKPDKPPIIIGEFPGKKHSYLRYALEKPFKRCFVITGQNICHQITIVACHGCSPFRCLIVVYINKGLSCLFKTWAQVTHFGNISVVIDIIYTFYIQALFARLFLTSKTKFYFRLKILRNSGNMLSSHTYTR